jgi:hypothetical protein
VIASDLPARHHRPGTAPGFSLVALNWIARIWLHGGYMEAIKQKGHL